MTISVCIENVILLIEKVRCSNSVSEGKPSSIMTNVILRRHASVPRLLRTGTYVWLIDNRIFVLWKSIVLVWFYWMN